MAYHPCNLSFQPMHYRTVHKIGACLLAAVWFMNGLFCKLLHLVPRHQLIVARILGAEYATDLTQIIGVLEVCMALWIVSAIKSRLCALMQIAVVASMNSIEVFLVPDLLLFGKWNAFFALLFIIIIYYNEWARNKEERSQTYL